jgi:predicted TIM-barrel fold metal-dependent hydrolase
MIIDAHVRIGAQRDTALDPDELIMTMDRAGVDHAIVAPSESQIAFDNRIGNETVAKITDRSRGRLLGYAVASPWNRSRALAELRFAHDHGAVALAVDAALQGFDLLDGQVEPLLEFAGGVGWPVYVRTGTPPTALPLPLATLALRFPQIAFIMGRSGATDFWLDAVPALEYAPNLYADTAYGPWDTILTSFAEHPAVGTDRVIFSSDAPYSSLTIELRRITDWDLADERRSRVLGHNLAGLLGARLPSTTSVD